MPRPKSEPSYHVHKRSGRAFTIIDRRQIPLGKGGSPESFTRFDQVRAQWLANGRKLPQETPRAPTPGSGGPTVAMLLEAFWRARVLVADKVDEEAMEDGSPARKHRNARRDRFASIVRLLNRLFGDLPTADFGCRELEAARQAMIAPPADLVTGQSPRGWTRNHVNQQVTRIRAIFRWGIVPKFVSPGVVAELEQLPELRRGDGGRETRPVRAAERVTALAIVPHVCAQVGAMIKLQLATGMRSSEVCIMRPCDIDRTKVPWEYRPAFHKTEHHEDVDRVVLLSPEAREIVGPFLKGRDPSAFLFSPAEATTKRRAEARAKREYIQPSQIRRSELAAKRKNRRAPGDRYTHGSYYAAVRRGCELAFGMPEEYRPAKQDRPTTNDSPETRREKDRRRHERQQLRRQWLRAHGFHPHQLRHSYGFWSRSELGLEAAQLQLGHKTTRMTERYAPPDARKVAALIERAR